jgi:hypothetical protein
MIELTEQQRRQLEGAQQPPVAADPKTGQEYLLIRREIYELVRATRSTTTGSFDKLSQSIAVLSIHPHRLRKRPVGGHVPDLKPHPRPAAQVELRG